MFDFIAPNSLPSYWQSKCSLNTKHIIDIPIINISGTKQRNCPFNVQSYIDQYGGVAKYGWTYSTLANVIIRFVGHIVVEKATGELLCVTPPELEISSIKFIPDDNVRIKTNSNGRLPVHTVALYDDYYLTRYADIENLISSIRAKYAARTSLAQTKKGVQLSQEDSIKYNVAMDELAYITNSHLLTSIVKNTKRNDKCPCGSMLKYKKCCYNRLT